MSLFRNLLKASADNATLESEFVGEAARVAVVVACVIAAVFGIRGTPSFAPFMALLAVVIVYTVVLAVMLKRGMLGPVFLFGFILDTLAIAGGWWLLNRNASEGTAPNDLYLTFFPIVASSGIRLGWKLGAMFAAGLIGWASWIWLTYYPAGHYAVEQLPIRVVFIGLTAAVTLGLAAKVKQEREKAEKARRENEGLANIGKLISSSLNPSDVFPRLADNIGALITADRIAVSVVEENSGYVTNALVAGTEVKELLAGSRSEVAGSAIEQVIATRKPVVLDEAAMKAFSGKRWPNDPVFKAGLRSVLLVPLIWQDRVAGVLHIKARRTKAYGPRETGLAEQIAAQIAGGLATSRLNSQLRYEAEVSKSLAAIAVAAGSDLELERAFDSVANEVGQLIPYDRFSIALKDSEGLRLSYVRGIEIPGSGVGSVIPGTAGTGPDTVIGARVSDSKMRRELEGTGLQSWLLVPIGTAQDEPLGTLSLRSRSEDAYSAKDLELLERVAQQLTHAIKNAVAHRNVLRLGEERERSARLESQTRELERVTQAKTEFLTNVSHELKTPLTSMLAFANLLYRNKDSNLGEKQLHQLQIIERNGRRLAVLIEDLVNVSNMENGRFRLAVTSFDLIELLNETAEGYVPNIEQKRQVLKVNLPAGPFTVQADRVRIAQVVTNLLGNAYKYSPVGTEITLSAKVVQDHVSVSVSDPGPGISPEDQKRLFSLFFRPSNETTQSVPGGGMGLFIARTLINLHGGEISLQSEPGRGTTVTFTVPRTVAADEKVA